MLNDTRRYRGARIMFVWVTAFAMWIMAGASALAQSGLSAGEALWGGESVDKGAAAFSPSECAYRSTQWWLEEVRAGVARGEVFDPTTRVIPAIPPGRRQAETAAIPCLSSAHIFPYEDTAQLLLTDFTLTQLVLDLMVPATNALMATHGDLYDFVGLWVNFTPHHTIGWAFHLGVENDVTGIGMPLNNSRLNFGLGGQNIEGMLMFWDINRPGIEPGTGPEAEDTRSTLAHEYAHRYGVFLPDLLDGRKMQGFGGAGCYGANHWNQQVDDQGSALGIAEWVGANPAVSQATFPNFFLINSDIGGFFSHTELYLMGYASPSEMDAGNSEFRYMDNWNCLGDTYNGPISTLSSADIIAAAGPRNPNSINEDHHYRTGWIMIHLPGDAPDALELAKAVGIHQQAQADWNFGTLGRGTMNHSLFNDCNCNGVPDATDIASGTSLDKNGNGIPDECTTLAIPTVTHWGMIALLLWMTASGIVILVRRRNLR